MVLKFNIMNICILKENKKNEFRVPLIPSDISFLKKRYKNYNFFIQPSIDRIIADTEYYKVGCKKYDNQKIDLFLSIKEINKKIIQKNQNFLMFSHTIKGQSYNMPMLRKLLDNNCSLIDYELLKDKKNQRVLGFGWFAGVMGTFLTLSKYVNYNKIKKLTYHSSEIIRILKQFNFDNTKVLITGDGLVSKGSQFLLKKIGFKEMHNNSQSKKPYFRVLKPNDYYSRIDGKFNLNDLLIGKGSYQNKFTDYIGYYDILISCHYWDSRFPKLFSLKDIGKNFFKIIGDITCDIKGSIPTTIKSTTLKSPYFNFKDINIMAVDNLPSALPLEASNKFSSKLKTLLPKIIKTLNQDTIEDFYIVKKGYLSYRFLNLINHLI